MVMIWNYYHLKRWNTKFTKNQDTFKNLYLLKNDKEKNMSCIWTTINIYYNKLQKQLFQSSFIWKSFFGKKDIQSYFTLIPLAHCIMFAPKFQYIEKIEHTFNYAILYQCKHEYKTFQVK
jgi:hypothetical protein